MTTLTLTPRNDIGAVLLEVASAPAGPVVIYREDINGPGEVRLLPDQEPISGALTVYDHEAALTGLVSYTVTDSAPATVSASVTMDGYYPIITAAALPQYHRIVTAVTEYDSGQDYGGTVLWIVDRPDPLVVTSPLRYREGSFAVRTADFDEATAVVNVASTGAIMLLRQNDHPGMDMYFVPRRARKAPITDGTGDWQVTFDYTQVKAPSGPLAGGLWNFDAAEALGTFDEVEALFATFNDSTVGP